MLRIGAQICTNKLLSNLTCKTTPNLIKAQKFVLQTTQTARHTSFFCKVNADMLWKGATTVSNAGKKRGRGKGANVKLRKNLNLGQQIGFGKKKVVWPGLSNPVLQGNTLVRIQKLPEDNKKEAPVAEKKMEKRTRRKIHPLERGWTAKSIGGKHLGPPVSTGIQSFENFDSIAIEHKLTVKMTSLFGRKRSFSSFVLVGNRNGIIGMGKATGLDGKVTINRAKNKAAKRLICIDLIDHTVNHDFFTQFGKTKIFVHKAPEGYGLKCQRVIKACCELLGIKNLHAQIVGSVNYKNIFKAFIIGLLQQKTHQQIADEKKLHLVEFKKERQNFPEVLASPAKCLTVSEARKDPVGFNEYIMGNRLVEYKKKMLPFYVKLPSWQTHLKRSIYKRNHFRVKMDMLVKYEKYRSYLGDYYPECINESKHKKNEKKQE